MNIDIQYAAKGHRLKLVGLILLFFNLEKLAALILGNEMWGN